MLDGDTEGDVERRFRRRIKCPLLVIVTNLGVCGAMFTNMQAYRGYEWIVYFSSVCAALMVGVACVALYKARESKTHELRVLRQSAAFKPVG